MALVAVFALVAGAAACGDDGKADTATERDETDDGEAHADDPPANPLPADPLPAELVGRTFLSETVTEDGEDHPLVEGTRIELGFPDEEAITVSAGCNQAGGSAAVESDRIVVGDLEWTLMGCDPPSKNEQDAWLGDFLSAGPAYRLEESRLTLEAGIIVIELVDSEAAADPDDGEERPDEQNGNNAVDDSEPDGQDPPKGDEPARPGGRSLPGTAWQVTGLVDGDTTSSVPDDADATITFEEDRVGVDACNTGGAGVEIAEAKLVFEPLIMTMMACQGSINDVEAVLMTVFDGEVTYEIEGDSLTVMHPNGKGVTLTRQS